MHNGHFDKMYLEGHFRHLLGNGTLATKMRKSSLRQMRPFTFNHHQAKRSLYLQNRLSLLYTQLNRRELSPPLNRIKRIKMSRLHLQNPQANLCHVLPPPTNPSQLQHLAPNHSPQPSPTAEQRSPAACPT